MGLLTSYLNYLHIQVGQEINKYNHYVEKG